MSLNLTVFQKDTGSCEVWQRQEGCRVIASVITVAVCNLALILNQLPLIWVLFSYYMSVTACVVCSALQEQ